jgi:hypothetical protein
MKILKFSEYTSEKLPQYESRNIEATSMNKDLMLEKEQLLNKINVIVGSASEAGIEIQILGEEIINDDLIIKVLINKIEHNFSIEDNLIKVDALDGGLLDNIKASPEKILNILIGKNPRRFYTTE